MTRAKNANLIGRQHDNNQLNYTALPKDVAAGISVRHCLRKCRRAFPRQRPLRNCNRADLRRHPGCDDCFTLDQGVDVTDQEIWNHFYLNGCKAEREADDDESDLSLAESVLLWAAFTLVILLLAACAALTAGILA